MRNSVLIAGLLLAACTPAPQPSDTPTPTAAPSTPAADILTQPRLDGVPVGARLTSPLVIEGIAPADWYFEAVFPVKLLGPKGEVIAEAPAQAQTDWTDPKREPIRFKVELTFTVKADTLATLVMEGDMPGQDDKGDDKPARTFRIPVSLAPSA